jgi:hypothetical protein
MSDRRNARIIGEDEVERALHFLADNAKEIGEAKAEMVRASHMIKVTKALCMRMYNDKPISAQEREAYVTAEYLAALERDAKAAGEYERLRALREAASMRIEAWRSQEATYRSMKL